MLPVFAYYFPFLWGSFLHYEIAWISTTEWCKGRESVKRHRNRVNWSKVSWVIEIFPSIYTFDELYFQIMIYRNRCSDVSGIIWFLDYKIKIWIWALMIAFNHVTESISRENNQSVNIDLFIQSLPEMKRERERCCEFVVAFPSSCDWWTDDDILNSMWKYH